MIPNPRSSPSRLQTSFISDPGKGLLAEAPTAVSGLYACRILGIQETQTWKGVIGAHKPAILQLNYHLDTQLSYTTTNMAVAASIDRVGTQRDSTLTPEEGPRGFVAVNHASSNGRILLSLQIIPYANDPW